MRWMLVLNYVSDKAPEVGLGKQHQFAPLQSRAQGAGLFWELFGATLLGPASVRVAGPLVGADLLAEYVDLEGTPV